MKRSIPTGIFFALCIIAWGFPGTDQAEAAPGDDKLARALAAKDGDPSNLPIQKAPALQRRNPRYQVGSGDVFDLNFSFTPEFNQTVTVQPDGYVNLRGVGDIHVEGMTAPEIQKAVEKSYSNILHDPVISVVLKDFEKPYFLALGQVTRPGKYDLRGNTTLADAVAIAGGLDGKAKHSQVLVFRRASADWVEVKTVNLKRMLNSGDLSEDVQIEPGDMVYVPQNAISKIRPFIPFPTLSYYIR